MGAIKMTPGARIAEIHARLDAVSAITADNEWEVDRVTQHGEDDYHHVIAFVKIGTERRVEPLFDSSNASHLLTEDDRRTILNFAASSRADVPWLLDQVVALRAALDKIATMTGSQPAAANMPEAAWYKGRFYDAVGIAANALKAEG